MNSVTRYMVREDWLLAAIEELRPRFEAIGFPLPPVIHVSTGFALAGKVENANIRAVTFADFVNDDGNLSVFMSPFEKDTAQVIMVLIHELIHVALNNQDGHTKRFREAALLLGLVPPLLSLHATVELEADALRLAAKLGDYPHAGMDKLRELITGTGPRDGKTGPQSETPNSKFWSAPPRQRNRQIRCQCTACGYTLRASRKWIDVKVPVCPVDLTEMVVEK